MKPIFSAEEAGDFSMLHLEVEVGEDWINRFLHKQQLIIPVNDQFSLNNLKLELEEGKITLQADIVEKDGSAVRLTCLPSWEPEKQRIQLDEIDIKLISKNILLKSAGWFATTFMGNKIDKKIEQTANQLYTNQTNKLIEEGIAVPIKDEGRAEVIMKSIVINEMYFLDHAIQVNVLIQGHLKLQL